MDRFLGKRLDGRYEIREILGVGGMAVVYKAYDNVEDRIVAIKILKQEFATSEEFLRRFKNESINFFFISLALAFVNVTTKKFEIGVGLFSSKTKSIIL